MKVSKHVSAELFAASDSGEFDVILSNATLDRDGEILAAEDWVKPLPGSIPINANHSSDVSDIVGSGRPWIDAEGNLRVTGKFATTEAGQHIRSLVVGGHLKAVSVEFLRRPDGRNELVGGAFVSVASNPTARVLASKSIALEQFKADLDRVLAGDRQVKSIGSDPSIQDIHDSSVALGAQCSEPDSDEMEKAARLLQLRLKLASG